MMNVFSNDAAARLLRQLSLGTAAYRKSHLEVQNTDLSPLSIVPQGPRPELVAPDGSTLSDIDSAIAVYAWLPDLDEVQASNIGLWTYLSHVEFRGYMLKRWPPTAKDARAQIKDRWFVTGNDRDLRRHGIAGLWWAAHATYAPWKKDPKRFGDLKRDDPFYFTRILLSTQEIYMSLMERSLARSDVIRIATLEMIDTYPQLAERAAFRTLMKKLNLALGSRIVSALSRDKVKLLIADLGGLQVGASGVALKNLKRR